MPFPAAEPVSRPVGEVLVCLQDAGGDTITLKGFVVNVGYMTAFSALAGSAMGGSEARRERLYGDFIDEVSNLYIDSLTHEQGDPSQFVQIYATIGKLRLFASADIASKADQVMRDISKIYYQPKRDFTKRQDDATRELNTLRAFSEACRDDLRN
jgi:hypothetical protein